MTKETKIGLLVGLAFVIVIGILLSDHLSGTNEPPQAPLQLAGTSVRSALGDPSDESGPVVKIPPVVVPDRVVPTHGDPVKKKTPGVTLVDPTVSRPPTTEEQPKSLKQIAADNGEPIEPVGPKPIPPVAPPTPPPVVAARSYVAKPGDSLGSIAKLAYGYGGRANRQLIAAANPSLADNPDLIVAGRTYVIPPPSTASSEAAPTIEKQPKPTETATDRGAVYVVKPHDTLWSIAVNQAGTAAAVAVIQELNPDALHGTTKVHAGMKLRLPGKKKSNDE